MVADSLPLDRELKEWEKIEGYVLRYEVADSLPLDRELKAYTHPPRRGWLLVADSLPLDRELKVRRVGDSARVRLRLQTHSR